MSDAILTPKVVLNAIAGLTGLAAAALWWIASTTKQKPMEAFVVHDTIAHELRYPYLDRIAKWNKWAALATGISVFTSAIGNYL